MFSNLCPSEEAEKEPQSQSVITGQRRSWSIPQPSHWFPDCFSGELAFAPPPSHITATKVHKISILFSYDSPLDIRGENLPPSLSYHMISPSSA